LQNNRLKVISAKSFPSSLNSFSSIMLFSNQIDAIDRKFLENAKFIYGIDLSGNHCFNSTVNDLISNREEGFALLEQCFSNYEALFPVTQAPDVKCYIGSLDDYICDLEIQIENLRRANQALWFDNQAYYHEIAQIHAELAEIKKKIE
jgi:hypothetical protein